MPRRRKSPLRRNVRAWQQSAGREWKPQAAVQEPSIWRNDIDEPRVKTRSKLALSALLASFRTAPMLLALRSRPPWKTSAYVCRSCRYQLQSARRLESTAVAAAHTGSEDGWVGNYQRQSLGHNADAERTQEGEQERPPGGKEQSSLEPPSRRLEPHDPAIKQLDNVTMAMLQNSLQRDRERLASLQQRKAARGAGTRRLASQRRSSQRPRAVSSVESRIGLFERVVELRKQGVLTEPTESGAGTAKREEQMPRPKIPRRLRKSIQSSSQDTNTQSRDNATINALLAERQALKTTLQKEFNQNFRLHSTLTPSDLRSHIKYLKRLIIRRRENAVSRREGEAEQSDARSANQGDRKSADDSGPLEETTQPPDASGTSKLENVIARLRQDFLEDVEYSNNVSPPDARKRRTPEHCQEEQAGGGGAHQSSSFAASSIVDPGKQVSLEKSRGSSIDLDSLRQQLERDTTSKTKPGRNLELAKTDHGQSVKEDASNHVQPSVRLSMPRFAATSDHTSSFRPVAAGQPLTVAQKVREARDRPKWGLSSPSQDDLTTQLPRSTKNKAEIVRKLQSTRRAPISDPEDEKVAPFFADSPAELAELQSSSVAPTDNAKEGKPRSSGSRERTLTDLRQKLGTAMQERKQTLAGGRSAAEERVEAIEKTIREYEHLDGREQLAEFSKTKDASERLAKLHRSNYVLAKGDKAAPVNRKVPDAKKDQPDQSQPTEPKKRGGRKSPRRALAEKKRAATVTSGSKTSKTGGDSAESAASTKLSQDLPSAAEESEPSAETDVPLEDPHGPPPSIASVKAADLHIDALQIPQPAVPALEYGLDKVLFNPGVYQLQDPTSRVYNFDPYLQDIMPAVEFDFNALKEYKTSSEDKVLSAIGKEHQKRYIGSTSSMTSTLAHFHYLLSNWRTLNLDMLSRGFIEKADEFTKINRAPNAIFLRWKSESKTYAIDADKEFDGANVLMMLGKSMEKLLTLPTSEFEKYRKSDPREVPQEARDEPEAFQYTTMGDFLMRSQLDAYDPRLPGTGMFDLKTRAVLSIRMDAEDFEPMLGYEIHTLQGRWNSYEREYYDMMRSTMLKYMLQARMGRMQGIFAAYHNIERIFGFQYISIMDMDRALHGQIDPCLGDQEFKLSLELLNKVLDKATAKFPEKSLRLHFETNQKNLGGEAPVSVMTIFAEPMEESEIKRIQSLSKEKVREFERTMMGIEDKEVKPETSAGVEEAGEVEDQAPTEYPPATPEPSNDELENGEPEPEEDSTPTTYPPATPEPPSSSSSNPDLTSSNSAADSDFLSNLTSSNSPSESNSASSPSSISKSDSRFAPLFAATMTIKSRVNGNYTPRPSELKRDDDWTVEYLLAEYPETASTWAHYAAMKARRKEVFTKERDEDEDVAFDANNSESEGGAAAKKGKKRDYFLEFLQGMAKRGREFRKEMDAAEKGRERKFAWTQDVQPPPATTSAAADAQEDAQAKPSGVGKSEV